MKTAYVNRKFRRDTLVTIAQANEIIALYQAQGLRLTLRQLYYQFVTRNWLRNTERSYKNLGNAISDGRLAGLIDWDAIEDRVRTPRVPQQFNNLSDLVSVALRAYRLPRWEGQENYVELWVEKDALAGVLEPIARQFHVTLMVNRGYSSSSAMHESAERFLEHEDSTCHLIYLGDHDPSGEDMVRDVRDRLTLFGVNLRVSKLALTMDQVEEYDPPPNPTKLSDSRAAAYVDKHGDSSWEVDALPPEVLQRLIVERLSELVDQDLMNTVIAREEKDKATLRKAVGGGR